MLGAIVFPQYSIIPLFHRGRARKAIFSLIGTKLMENGLSNHLEIRCPKLGGEVTFAYCLIEGGDLPCSRTIVCWQQYFPVETHLRAKLTPEQWDRCFNQTPKEKMVSLMELIEAAKKRQQADS